MRVAIFSDIHGNAVELDACLSDVALAGGTDPDALLVSHAPPKRDDVRSRPVPLDVDHVERQDKHLPEHCV